MITVAHVLGKHIEMVRHHQEAPYKGKEMNVIFLDIDGVLNWARSFGQPTKHSVWVIDPELVARLNRILESVDNLTIVLSSSWRYAVAKNQIDLNQLLREQGYNGPQIIERTVLDSEIGEDGFVERGNEIQMWLDQHPEVERFVILDDDDDMGHLKPNLVQTSFENGGLTDEHVNEIIRRLMPL